VGCATSCGPYSYKVGSAAGKILALWPGSTMHYLEAVKTPRFEDYHIKYSNRNRFQYLGNGHSTAEQPGETSAITFGMRMILPLIRYSRSQAEEAQRNKTGELTCHLRPPGFDLRNKAGYLRGKLVGRSQIIGLCVALESSFISRNMRVSTYTP
jgi:hypothetical protein